MPGSLSWRSVSRRDQQLIRYVSQQFSFSHLKLESAV